MDLNNDQQVRFDLVKIALQEGWSIPQISSLISGLAGFVLDGTPLPLQPSGTGNTASGSNPDSAPYLCHDGQSSA